jgi:hypothetical protein
MSYDLYDTGYKFGAGGYGVSGGTVTYSFATANFANEAFTYDSFLTGQYQTEVRAALAAWEAVANIHFVEVTDSTVSDLRFGFVNNFAAKPWAAAEAGGAGGRAGQASVFYDNSPIHHVTDADIAFDGREGWQVVNGEILTGPGGTRFFSIALHEIGHVLGIDHDVTAGERSIMQSSLDPSYRGLEAVDIQAAQFIYGAAAAPVAGSISISDAPTVTEGNSGTKEAIFTITRAAGSGTAAFDVTLNTANGIATTADGDYVGQSNVVLHFNEGQMNQTVKILVNGDTKFEGNENFFVNLSNATNGAIITKAQATGNISNDDAAPVAGSISIGDAPIVVEGNSGTKEAIFTITRAAGSGTAAFDVTLNTANGIATTADGDYVGQSNVVVHFNAGQMTQTVKILVNGDTKVEGSENFFVNLSNATNGATITRAQAVGTITNDDTAPINAAPVVTAHDVSVATNGSIAASSMFVAHDQQGDNTITQYAFWDAGTSGGRFTVNGVTQASGQWITVSASNLASVSYVGGNTVGNEKLFVSAFDGTTWSTNAQLTALTEARAPEDFGGDGKSDILWISDSGSVAMWQMNGAQIASNAAVGSIATSWHAEGTEDFNGDGKSDILWVNDNGSVAMWQMNGNQVASNVGVGSIGTNWHVAATDDFNGDGKADILWQSNSGGLAMWQMNGAQIASNTTVGSIANGWEIAGSGDFNADGKGDLLLVSNTGSVAMWQMNGNQIALNQSVGTMGTSWHVAGVEDFNGDGKSDILWHNDNGSVAMWQMNGNQITKNQTVGSVGSDWNIADTGDYNNDGFADIAWQSDSGSVAMWLMQDTQILASTAVNTVGADWHLF